MEVFSELYAGCHCTWNPPPSIDMFKLIHFCNPYCQLVAGWHLNEMPSNYCLKVRKTYLKKAASLLLRYLTWIGDILFTSVNLWLIISKRQSLNYIYVCQKETV